MIITPTAAVNAAVGRARDLPGLIVQLTAINPALAAQLLAKPLAYSKSVWGTTAASFVAWASTRYGLGWDANTCAAVAGVVVLLASAAFRSVTSRPIAGLFTVPPEIAAPSPTVTAQTPLSPPAP